MDSGTTHQSPAAEIKMLCFTCKAPMEWRQARRAWYCTGDGCNGHLTSGAVFVDPDASFMLECGVALEKLKLRPSIIARTKSVANETRVGDQIVKHFYVVLPYKLPEKYEPIEELEYDAEKKLSRLIGQSPWSKREAA
jgi:hypothetical protein